MFTIIIIFIVLIYFFGDKIQKYLQKSSKDIIYKKEHYNSNSKKEHYNSVDDVKNTNAVQKTNAITQQNNYTVILCYADWCSHCPTVKLWYNDLVNQSPLSKCVFYAIEEKDLPEELLNKIPGFPTILIQKDKSINVYDGPRSKDSLLSYLEKL